MFQGSLDNFLQAGVGLLESQVLFFVAPGGHPGTRGQLLTQQQELESQVLAARVGVVVVVVEEKAWGYVTTWSCPVTGHFHHLGWDTGCLAECFIVDGDREVTSL